MAIDIVSLNLTPVPFSLAATVGFVLYIFFKYVIRYVLIYLYFCRFDTRSCCWVVTRVGVDTALIIIIFLNFHFGVVSKHHSHITSMHYHNFCSTSPSLWLLLDRHLMKLFVACDLYPCCLLYQWQLVVVYRYLLSYIIRNVLAYWQPGFCDLLWKPSIVFEGLHCLSLSLPSLVSCI